MAESYDERFQELQSVFKRSCTILQPQQKCMKFPVVFTFLPTLFMSLLFSKHPYGFAVTSHVALIQISLTSNDAQHLYLPLLATFIPSLEKCLLKSFGHF